jgi:hypothetical protein
MGSGMAKTAMHDMARTWMLLEDFLVLEGELTSEERMSTESGLGELSLESSWM